MFVDASFPDKEVFGDVIIQLVGTCIYKVSWEQMCKFILSYIWVWLLPHFIAKPLFGNDIFPVACICVHIDALLNTRLELIEKPACEKLAKYVHVNGDIDWLLK